jgi:DNA-directed RNA polymerase specialized sigma24 family protein
MHLELRGAEKLSHRERQVVVLKEMGKTSDKIGKNLGLSTATVNTLYSRAKMKGYQVVIIIPGEEWGVNLYDTDAEEE